MSELLGADENIFPLWVEQFAAKPTIPGLDWPSKEPQQVQNIPVFLLDDGRVAFQNEQGKYSIDLT